MAVDVTWPEDGLTPWGSPLRNGLDELQDAINSNESRIEPLEGVPNDVSALQLSVGALQSKTTTQSTNWPTTVSETSRVVTGLLQSHVPGAWAFTDTDGSYGTPATGAGTLLVLPTRSGGLPATRTPVTQILSYTSGVAAGNTYTRYFNGTEWSDWVQIGPEGPKGDKGDKGDPGEDGTGISISGSVADYASLPTTLTGADAGKSYFVEADGLLYIWDGSQFPEDGNGITFRGPQGVAGPEGPRGPAGQGNVALVAEAEGSYPERDEGLQNLFVGSLNPADLMESGDVWFNTDTLTSEDLILRMSDPVDPVRSAIQAVSNEVEIAPIMSFGAVDNRPATIGPWNTSSNNLFGVPTLYLPDAVANGVKVMGTTVRIPAGWNTARVSILWAHKEASVSTSARYVDCFVGIRAMKEGVNLTGGSGSVQVTEALDLTSAAANVPIAQDFNGVINVSSLASKTVRLVVGRSVRSGANPYLGQIGIVEVRIERTS